MTQKKFREFVQAALAEWHRNHEERGIPEDWLEQFARSYVDPEEARLRGIPLPMRAEVRRREIMEASLGKPSPLTEAQEKERRHIAEANKRHRRRQNPGTPRLFRRY